MKLITLSVVAEHTPAIGARPQLRTVFAGPRPIAVNLDHIRNVQSDSRRNVAIVETTDGIGYEVPTPMHVLVDRINTEGI